MKQGLRNLLPEDTRLVEIVSAVTMILSAVAAFFGLGADHGLHLPLVFSTFIIAVLQLISIVFLDRRTFCRVYSSLFMGGLMLYLSFLHIHTNEFYNYITQLVLGFANLYAFLVNDQRLVWK